jgi:hypothetical protein
LPIVGRTLTIARGRGPVRALAVVYADGQSNSCNQIAAGQAIYVAKWDKGGRVADECGVR